VERSAGSKTSIFKTYTEHLKRQAAFKKSSLWVQ